MKIVRHGQIIVGDVHAEGGLSDKQRLIYIMAKDPTAADEITMSSKQLRAEFRRVSKIGIDLQNGKIIIDEALRKTFPNLDVESRARLRSPIEDIFRDKKRLSELRESRDAIAQKIVEETKVDRGVAFVAASLQFSLLEQLEMNFGDVFHQTQFAIFMTREVAREFGMKSPSFAGESMRYLVNPQAPAPR